jgi:hypothetical protein
VKTTQNGFKNYWMAQVTNALSLLRNKKEDADKATKILAIAGSEKLLRLYLSQAYKKCLNKMYLPVEVDR